MPRRRWDVQRLDQHLRLQERSRPVTFTSVRAEGRRAAPRELLKGGDGHPRRERGRERLNLVAIGPL